MYFSGLLQSFKKVNFYKFIYFVYFIFGCIGSLLLCVAFSLVVVRGLLTAVASLVAEHRLQACGLSSCGSRA